MRQRLLVGAGAVLTALAALPEPAISGVLDYIMVNNTSQPIVRIWASPTTDPNWIESTDVYVPKDGGSQNQTFTSTANGSDCYYDIRIQFQGGEKDVINHINLCSTSKITIDADSNGNVTYNAN